MDETPRILIVGGGYVGMYAALRLQRKLRPGEASITVVDPRSTMTYQPFLAEAAAARSNPGTWWCRSAKCCAAAGWSPAG